MHKESGKVGWETVAEMENCSEAGSGGAQNGSAQNGGAQNAGDKSAGDKNSSHQSDGAENEAIDQLITSAIRKGTFSPIIQLDLERAHIHQTVALLACDPVEILNQTPLATHRYFLSHGYRCVTSITANLSHNQLVLNATHSWDQQLILSIWHCLKVLEGSEELLPQGMSVPSRLHYSPPECLKTTAQLSPKRRLERFANDVIFRELKDAPMAIFIDSLEPFQGIPHALETLFTWIWQCYQQLEQQTKCHPLRFVVLGKMVT